MGDGLTGLCSRRVPDFHLASAEGARLWPIVGDEDHVLGILEVSLTPRLELSYFVSHDFRRFALDTGIFF